MLISWSIPAAEPPKSRKSPDLARIWDQVPKIMKNFKISQKITFSKLVRGSFLHIPCALWELRNTSKRVFRINFEPFRSPDRTWIWDSGWKKNTSKNLENKFSKHVRKSFLNIPCTLWVMPTPLNIFSHAFRAPFYPTQTEKTRHHKTLVFLNLARIGSCVSNCALLDSIQYWF